MNPELIQAVMNHRGGRKRKPHTGIATGSFQGKLGTPRRSRKGAITRRGGYITYCPTTEEWKRLGLCGGK